MYQRASRLALVIGLLCLCVGCDQGSKQLAQLLLADHESVSLLAGVLHLTYAENPGAFLSLGAQWPAGVRLLLLVGLTALIIFGLGMLLLLSANDRLLRSLSPLLLVAGGLGNLLDRLSNHGAVIDFLVVDTGLLHTGIFNFADMFIVLGVVLAPFFWPIRQRR